MTFEEVWWKDVDPWSSKSIFKKVARQKWIDDFDIKWIQFDKGIRVYKWDDGSIKPYDHSEDEEDDWIELT